MCPALMLAANRKDRVIGRTEILVVSMSTKNGFSHLGAPPGKIAAKNFGMDIEIDDIIRANHSGKARLKIKNKWLEILKTYGKRPLKFVAKIIIKRVDKIGENPFRLFPKIRAVWLCIMDLG